MISPPQMDLPNRHRLASTGRFVVSTQALMWATTLRNRLSNSATATRMKDATTAVSNAYSTVPWLDPGWLEGRVAARAEPTLGLG